MESVFISDYASLSSRQRKRLARVSHARTLRLGSVTKCRGITTRDKLKLNNNLQTDRQVSSAQSRDRVMYLDSDNRSLDTLKQALDTNGVWREHGADRYQHKSVKPPHGHAIEPTISNTGLSSTQ